MRVANRYLEALKENGNIVGLTSALALSAATLNPLPILVGLVVEAAYLIFVPDSKWYDTRLAKRYDAEVEKRRQQLKAEVVPTLPPNVQERFERLEEMRRQIGAQRVEGQTWFREVLRKLDYLLEKFLQFASKDLQFRSHLRSVLDEVRGDRVNPSRRSQGAPGGWMSERRPQPRGRTGGPRTPQDTRPADRSEELPRDPSIRWVEKTVTEIQSLYDEEMDEIRGLIQAEHDLNTKAVLEKRLEVLQRRHEFVRKMGKILLNLNHQLKLLEDSFGLINDELRARSPEQVLADIEDVVWQTNAMTNLLEEVAPYERMLERLST